MTKPSERPDRPAKDRSSFALLREIGWTLFMFVAALACVFAFLHVFPVVVS